MTHLSNRLGAKERRQKKALEQVNQRIRGVSGHVEGDTRLGRAEAERKVLMERLRIKE
jgi:hypothetical protein